MPGIAGHDSVAASPVFGSHHHNRASSSHRRNDSSTTSNGSNSSFSFPIASSKLTVPSTSSSRHNTNPSSLGIPNPRQHQRTDLSTVPKRPGSFIAKFRRERPHSIASNNSGALSFEQQPNHGMEVGSVGVESGGKVVPPQPSNSEGKKPQHRRSLTLSKLFNELSQVIPSRSSSKPQEHVTNYGHVTPFPSEAKNDAQSPDLMTPPPSATLISSPSIPTPTGAASKRLPYSQSGSGLSKELSLKTKEDLDEEEARRRNEEVEEERKWMDTIADETASTSEIIEVTLGKVPNEPISGISSVPRIPLVMVSESSSPPIDPLLQNTNKQPVGLGISNTSHSNYRSQMTSRRSSLGTSPLSTSSAKAGTPSSSRHFRRASFAPSTSSPAGSNFSTGYSGVTSTSSTIPEGSEKTTAASVSSPQKQSTLGSGGTVMKWKDLLLSRLMRKESGSSTPSRSSSLHSSPSIPNSNLRHSSAAFSPKPDDSKDDDDDCPMERHMVDGMGCQMLTASPSSSTSKKLNRKARCLPIPRFDPIDSESDEAAFDPDSEANDIEGSDGEYPPTIKAPAQTVRAKASISDIFCRPQIPIQPQPDPPESESESELTNLASPSVDYDGTVTPLGTISTATRVALGSPSRAKTIPVKDVMSSFRSNIADTEAPPPVSYALPELEVRMVTIPLSELPTTKSSAAVDSALPGLELEFKNDFHTEGLHSTRTSQTESFNSSRKELSSATFAHQDYEDSERYWADLGKSENWACWLFGDNDTRLILTQTNLHQTQHSFLLRPSAPHLTASQSEYQDLNNDKKNDIIDQVKKGEDLVGSSVLSSTAAKLIPKASLKSKSSSFSSGLGAPPPSLVSESSFLSLAAQSGHDRLRRGSNASEDRQNAAQDGGTFLHPTARGVRAKPKSPKRNPINKENKEKGR